jgi:hypothetical protein
MLALTCLMSACGSARYEGDMGGVRMQIQTHLEGGFLTSMHPLPSHGSISSATENASPPVGGATIEPGFALDSVKMTLIAYDGATHNEVFRRSLIWGDTSFSIHLIPGHRLTLEVFAEGGREGVESLGPITVPAANTPHIAITLTDTTVEVICGTPPTIPGPAPAH